MPQIITVSIYLATLLCWTVAIIIIWWRKPVLVIINSYIYYIYLLLFFSSSSTSMQRPSILLMATAVIMLGIFILFYSLSLYTSTLVITSYVGNLYVSTSINQASLSLYLKIKKTAPSETCMSSHGLHFLKTTKIFSGGNSQGRPTIRLFKCRTYCRT